MYTGDVSVGGPADVRSLPEITITKLAVGPMDNNVYLLRSTSTGEALLIDAAAEGDRVLDLAGRDGPVASQVLTTHRHGDHTGALADYVSGTGATTLAGDADADALPVPVDVRLRDGDTVTVGDLSLSVIGLRGHTPGSVAVLYTDADGGSHLFTGDSLFPGGVGNTGSPADFRSLIEDVSARVFDRLPNTTWVYPGHGHDTTLGAERPHLPEWRDRGW